MDDARQRFTITVDDYERYRPSYPDALYDELTEAASLRPGATVVDVGCGTGISTRPWQARGIAAIGVEPNRAMRERALATGGARYLEGTADATTLPACSTDLVCAAQAFHWFPIDATLVEWRRILRPGAVAAVFWNVRDQAPLMREYEALLDTLGEYQKVPKPEPTLAKLRAHPSVRVVRELELPNVQWHDRDGFFGRARSSSYVAHSPAERDRVETALADLYLRHHRADGQIAFTYTTVAMIFAIDLAPDPHHDGRQG